MQSCPQEQKPRFTTTSMQPTNSQRGRLDTRGVEVGSDDVDSFRETSSMSSCQSSVSFNEVEVRSYNIIVGDNPSTNTGPPISLGWDYYLRDDARRSLDEYEFQRLTRRSHSEMFMPKDVRMKKLQGEGVSFIEMRNAERDVQRAQQQRDTTIESLRYQKAEEVLETATRRLKRTVTMTSKKQEQEKLWINAQKATTEDACCSDKTLNTSSDSAVSLRVGEAGIGPKERAGEGDPVPVSALGDSGQKQGCDDGYSLPEAPCSCFARASAHAKCASILLFVVVIVGILLIAVYVPGTHRDRSSGAAATTTSSGPVEQARVGADQYFQPTTLPTAHPLLRSNQPTASPVMPYNHETIPPHASDLDDFPSVSPVLEEKSSVHDRVSYDNQSEETAAHSPGHDEVDVDEHEIASRHRKKPGT